MTRRKLGIALIAILAMTAMVALAADKPDFSGNWKLNAAKSDFGQFPAPDKLEMKVDHKEPALNVTLTQVSQMGERISDAKYTTDGKECVNGEGRFQSTSTVAWDGSVLVTKSTRKFSRDGEEMVIQGEDRWTLSEDGKTLTSEMKMVSSMGEIVMKRVLEKQ